VSNLKEKRDQWLAANRGILARISEELGITPQFVGDVFWGRRTSRSGQVEGRLAELGAPGVERREVA
jgi:hypothetical protein